MMQIQVEHGGAMVYMFQSCIPCASGLAAETVRVKVKGEVIEALELVKHIKISSAA